MFYLDVIMYRNSLNKSPKWIIPRKANSLWEKETKDKYDFVINMIDSMYTKIVINSTDYIYPLDSPNPRTHRFKENKELRTSNVYPYETYPIEVYHLK